MMPAVVLAFVASGLNAVFIRQDYHDLYDKFMGHTDVTAAGFKMDAESSILADKSDDHTKNVFDPSVRGHTDQFLYRFKKPK